MKSIFQIFFVINFGIFLSGCGGYLPSAPTNWSANPAEMHVWTPPDEAKLAERRQTQQDLDNLTKEVERLFVNQDSLEQQEVAMAELIRKTDSDITSAEKDFSTRISKEMDRNKTMQSDLKKARADYGEQRKKLRKLSVVKPPVIFSTTDYNSAMKAFSEGKYSKSIKLFNRLGKQNPPMFLQDNIHFGMGSSYYRLKKYPKARKHFQKIIDDYSMGDKGINSYVMLGIIDNMQGEKSRALYLLNEALSKNPPERMKPMIDHLINSIGKESTHASN